MPKWIHDRARHIMAKNPSMPESEAWAIATQQSHALGKSPKSYGTVKGREEAKDKYSTPEDDKKTAGVLSDLYHGVFGPPATPTPSSGNLMANAVNNRISRNPTAFGGAAEDPFLKLRKQQQSAWVKLQNTPPSGTKLSMVLASILKAAEDKRAFGLSAFSGPMGPFGVEGRPNMPDMGAALTPQMRAAAKFKKVAMTSPASRLSQAQRHEVKTDTPSLAKQSKPKGAGFGNPMTANTKFAEDFDSIVGNKTALEVLEEEAAKKSKERAAAPSEKPLQDRVREALKK